MEVSTTQGLVPLKPLQVMQISIEPFSMMGIDQPLDVMAPLVSTSKRYDGTNVTMNVKIVAIVPKGTSGETFTFFRDETAAPGELVIVVQFLNDLKDVKEYEAWYVCFEYPVRSEDEIRTVHTYLIDIKDIDGNPRTKRGTVTQVLES